VPKHFARLQGEAVIERIVRLFRPHVEEMIVVGPDERYALPGTELHIPTHLPEFYEADKFACSADLWNPEGRTLVLLGDVFFTQEAARRIVEFDEREWRVFGRFGPSALTGTPWGELFAQSFWPEHLEEHAAALVRIADLRQRKVIGRAAGWEHWRAMNNVPDHLMGQHIQYERMVEIDDFTDDIDFPADYDRMVKRLPRRTV